MVYMLNGKLPWYGYYNGEKIRLITAVETPEEVVE